MMVALSTARTDSPQSRLTRQVFNMLTLLVFLHAVIHSTTAVVRSGGEFDGEIVKVVCQGETLKIRCPNSSYALSILGGSYGRIQPGNIVCPYEGSEKDFYYNCGENDIADKLKQICKRKKKCNFQVGKALFGDPCDGHAYLTIIYSCVKKKKRKPKKKPTKMLPTTYPTNTTTRSITTTVPTDHGWNSSANPTIINGKEPGIIMSIIIWIVYVTTNSRSFLTVFLITFGSAAVFFLLIFLVMGLRQRHKTKHRRKTKLDNCDAQMQRLNTMMSSNCDVKKKSDFETLSNSTFPAPPPALPPPPDDVMYPSPDMINSSRPPPPPVFKGRSLDDISKIGQDPKKHVPVTRSISLRTTRPVDYTLKEVNVAKLPNIDGAAEIQAVVIQRNNGSAMYINPMYENGHMKEVTC